MHIKSDAKPISKKLGTVTKIDAQTGQVLETKKNAFTLLGPPPDKCQVCATDHEHNQPHNKDSLFYQYRFYSEHGRWPNWVDAMAHCDDATKRLWTEKIIEVYKERGLEVPGEFLTQKPIGR